jgi:hypothetical protein
MNDRMKKNYVSRRRFIKSGMIAVAGLPVMRMYPLSDAGWKYFIEDKNWK